MKSTREKWRGRNYDFLLIAHEHLYVFRKLGEKEREARFGRGAWGYSCMRGVWKDLKVRTAMKRINKRNMSSYKFLMDKNFIVGRGIRMLIY